MGGGVHDGIGALPDGIGLCPHATVPARAGNGGTGSPPVRGHRQNFTKALRGRRWPPEGGPVSLEAMGGGVHDRIGARPPGGSESLHKILTMPLHGREPIPPCPHRAQPLRARSRAGKALFCWATPLFRRAPRPLASREVEPPSGGHRWPPGGSESVHKILTMPPHGRRASSTVPPPCPALAGTVTSGQSPILAGNAPIPLCTPPPMASREPEPPSGGHRAGPPCAGASS